MRQIFDVGHWKEKSNRKPCCLLYYLSTALLAFIFFVSAIKFGSVVDVTGIGFYPLSPIEWALSPWPPFLVPVLTGIALLLTLVTSARLDIKLFRCYGTLFVPTGMLVATSVIGLIHTTEMNYALLFLGHTLAVFSFSLSVFIHTANFPDSKHIFFLCIVSSAIYVMIVGLIQVDSGFQEIREMAIKSAKDEGRILSSAMLNRLNQTRVFATFTYPNSYAAHLILTIPLVLVFVWRWSRSIRPQVVGQVVITGLMALLSLAMLYYSGSRGALVAFTLSGLSIVFLNFSELCEWIKHHKRLFAIIGWGIILIVVFLTVSAFRGRNLASFSARFDYYSAAVNMFLIKPILGVGLGEFYPWYMRLKPIDAEETRLVHNLFLHFLSQCGILGGAAAGYFLIHPFLIGLLVKRGYLKVESSVVFKAILLGCIAWNTHSLTDFNVQIPGTMLIVASLPLLALKFGDYKSSTSQEPKSKIMLIILVVISGFGISCIWRLPGEKSYQILYDRFQARADARSLINDANSTAALLPFSPYPWDLLGRSAFINQDYLLGETAFREASKRTPHRAAYHAYLAQSLLAQGKVEEAEKSIDTALIWYPFKPEFQRIKDYIRSSQ